MSFHLTFRAEQVAYCCPNMNMSQVNSCIFISAHCLCFLGGWVGWGAFTLPLLVCFSIEVGAGSIYAVCSWAWSLPRIWPAPCNGQLLWSLDRYCTVIFVLPIFPFVYIQSFHRYAFLLGKNTTLPVLGLLCFIIWQWSVTIFYLFIVEPDYMVTHFTEWLLISLKQ